MDQRSIPGTRRCVARAACGLLTALLLWSASQAAAQSVAFPFLSARDEVGQAMARLWHAQFQAPSADATTAAEALQARVDDSALVRENADAAAAHLLEALRPLQEHQAAELGTLASLLRLVGEQREILAHLRLILLQEAPRPLPPGADGEVALPAGRLFRTTALAHVADVAASGSDLARQHLLELLGSRDPVVRSGAIQGVYRASPSRRAAQRVMRPRLDPDQHHLLYRH